MSDEEFEKVYIEAYGDEPELAGLPEDFEDRIQEHIDKLGEDYDLDDMKINDMIQLRELVMAMIQLEDLELVALEERQKIDPSNIVVLDKVNRIISNLRSDISSISEDLQLTKRARSRSKDATVADAWKKLTKTAHEFYQKRMLYIFCTECRMLLSTIWLNYNDNEHNQISLYCERCDNIEVVNLKELYNKNNKNLEDVLLP
jgi:hypothetical protein